MATATASLIRLIVTVVPLLILAALRPSIDTLIGKQANMLVGNLASFDDPRVYNIAEIGMGLNPYSRLTRCMLNDEGVLRTLHIGIGNRYHLGRHG